jgi:hypothetical protein
MVTVLEESKTRYSQFCYTKRVRGSFGRRKVRDKRKRNFKIETPEIEFYDGTMFKVEGGIQDYNGVRYGHLIVVKDFGDECLCVCDCKSKRRYSKKDLDGNKVKDCGCSNLCRSEYLPQRRLFFQYIRGAKKRRIRFNLTFNEFLKLISGQCEYCGCAPRSVVKTKKEYVFYNGIDRFDNNAGYNTHNCVTCCSVCNRMKLNLTYTDFKYKIKQIAKRIEA